MTMQRKADGTILMLADGTLMRECCCEAEEVCCAGGDTFDVTIDIHNTPYGGCYPSGCGPWYGTITMALAAPGICHGGVYLWTGACNGQWTHVYVYIDWNTNTNYLHIYSVDGGGYGSRTWVDYQGTSPVCGGGTFYDQYSPLCDATSYITLSAIY
jgi:hypothetical protein